MNQDTTLDDFCTKVLDWRHRTIPRVELERVASHLRDVVTPQLEELAALRAAKAARRPASIGCGKFSTTEFPRTAVR